MAYRPLYHIERPKAKEAYILKMEDHKEPKELNWWIKATQLVRATLKPYIEAYNAKHSKKLSGTIHVSVAKALKSANQLSSTVSPKEADIIAVYKSLLPEEAQEETFEEPNDKILRLSKLLDDFFDGTTTEIIIRRKRRGCCWF